MKSIKPGRGPSKMGAVGSGFAVVFGVFWCILAAAMGAWFMIPFGLIFIGFAAYSGLYNAHNATAEDRYSIVDIVDSEEEDDPYNVKYGRRLDVIENAAEADFDEERGFCPYCGKTVEGDYEFCPKCGKKLPVAK